MNNTQRIKGFFVQNYNKAFLFFTDIIYRKFLYTSLFELPLKNYIDVAVDGNYRKLRKISLPVPMKVYKDVYSDLIEQYMELSGNDNLKAEKERQEDENDLKKKVYLYSVGLSVLVQFEQTDGIMSYFENEGIAGTVEQVAKRVDAELKVMKIELEGLEKLKLQNPKEKTTRQDFSKTIAMACKNGYNVHYEMSTADFIQTLNIQREEIKNLERLTKK